MTPEIKTVILILCVLVISVIGGIIIARSERNDELTDTNRNYRKMN